LAEHGAVCVIAQIGGEAFLVAVDCVKQAVGAANLGVGQIQRPAQITLARPFDLDHSGAQIGQFQAAERPLQELAEIHNQNTVQGKAHARLS
jgi:hypothetical protein